MRDLCFPALRPPIVAKKRSFTFGNVKGMTNNFARVVGEGGFGIVYHGYLNQEEQVAAKVLSQSSAQGYEQFKAEVELLIRVHHVNLVSLVGYCDEGDHLVLIYEYMHNEDLRKLLSGKLGYDIFFSFLFISRYNIWKCLRLGNDHTRLPCTGECASPPLSWENRLRIAAETAQGLEYLHIGCKPPMIHRDVKSTNILLDEHFQAKFGDFGLSRYSPTGSETHVSTNVVGSPGYLDPELTNGDIRNIVDPSLVGDFCSSSMWKALELAMSCVTPSSSRRPTMSQVASELKACLFSEKLRKGGTPDVDLNSFIEPSMSVGIEENPDAR
ncbi:hypothetical protein YC2023_105409 [Brassica napus]